MEKCRYCEEVFESGEAYLSHLAEYHGGELGRIDRRRVENHVQPESDSGPNALVVLAVVLGVASLLGGISYVVLFSGASGASDTATVGQQPAGIGSVHYHGTMEMIVTGERVDFIQNRFQLRADAFHFEGGQGVQWHGHARGVTLEYALESLGFGVTSTAITIDGTTYQSSASNTSVQYLVNGEQVSPRTYVLRTGDQIRIIVERT